MDKTKDEAWQPSDKPFFGLFVTRTSTYYIDQGMATGQAEYVATGRSYATMNASFATLFSLYATSHFYFAFELIIVSAVYGAVKG